MYTLAPSTVSGSSLPGQPLKLSVSLRWPLLGGKGLIVSIVHGLCLRGRSSVTPDLEQLWYLICM